MNSEEDTATQDGMIFNYYHIAADSGKNSEAQFKLAKIYLHKNEKQATRQAIHYLKLAAHSDNQEACYELAKIYEEGKILKKNCVKALYFYEKSSGNNNEEVAFEAKKGIMRLQNVNNNNYVYQSSN